MPRKRKPADAWMPLRVYRGKTSYEYRPKGGGCVTLCPLDSPQSKVYLEYERAKKEDGKTLAKLVGDYFKSPQFLKLADDTKLDYKNSWKKINVFAGNADPDKITTPILRKYADKRGLVSEYRANREIRLLSTIFSWGVERGYCKGNPAKLIRGFTEKPRDRYITDEEYKIMFDLAPLSIQVAMELSYLCAARQKDILELKWADIREDGIYIEQSKTGKKQIKSWTPGLKLVIEQAKKLPGVRSTIYVITNKQGKPYTRNGFKGMWGKTMDKAQGIYRRKAKETEQEFLLNEAKFQLKYPPLIKDRFTYHDIKAKSISDYEQGDKQEFSGHFSRSQTDKYDRKIKVVSTLERKKI